jgi:ribosomal protein S2
MKQLFDKTSVFFLSRKRYKVYKGLKKQFNYLRIRQLKNLYFVGYWRPGYLTNRFNFFETRLKKQLTAKYPQFGFINDYKTNLIALKEFKFSKIPYSSMVNLNVSKTNHGMYDIPGNGMSYDTVYFNLNLAAASAIYGYCQLRKRFLSLIYGGPILATFGVVIKRFMLSFN